MTKDEARMFDTLKARRDAAKSTPAPDGPHCQRCGGVVEGWTCQGCGQAFHENGAGDLVFVSGSATTPAPDVAGLVEYLSGPLYYDRAKGKPLNEQAATALTTLSNQVAVLRGALERIVNGPWPDDVDSPLAQAKWDEKIARAALAHGQSGEGG